MGLRDERNYQKLLEALDAMALSAENRELAETYLDMSFPENAELLKQMKRQDFSQLAKEEQRKCQDYAEHLKKRKRTEELERYVKLAAAIGGSTAGYVIFQYEFEIDSLAPYLTPTQFAAIYAELNVWRTAALTRYRLKKLIDMGKENPQTLADAIELCYHQYANAKVLLFGAYFYCVEPKKKGGLRGLFSSDKPGQDQNEKLLADLIDDLAGNMNPLLGGSPAQADMETLEHYVRKADPKAELPSAVRSVLQRVTFAEYLSTLFGSAAFLALRHSERCAAFLRLLMEANLEKALEICANIAGPALFEKQSPVLEEFLQSPDRQEAYIAFCVQQDYRKTVLRLVGKFPQAAEAAAKNASSDQYAYLLQCIRETDKKLYQKLESGYQDQYRQKTAKELADSYKSGQQEIEEWLQGKAGLQTLYPLVKGWRSDGYDYYNKRAQTMYRLKEAKDELYERMAVVEALAMHGNYFIMRPDDRNRTNQIVNAQNRISLTRIEPKKEDFDELLDVFDRQGLPFAYQMEGLEGICIAHMNWLYSDGAREEFFSKVVSVLAKRFPSRRDDFLAASRDCTAFARFLCVRTMSEFWEDNKDGILACASDSAKQVREEVVRTCVNHKEWEADVLRLLTSRKSQERELAAQVIEKWGADAYREPLLTALANEKSKKLKELLQRLTATSAETEDTPTGEPSLDELVKSILKGGRARKLAWLYEGGAAYPQVRTKAGKTADEDYVKALLLCYADMNLPGVNADAARIAQALNEDDLAAYVRLVYGRFLESGAAAKNKWALYAASIHGGSAIVGELQHQIQEWPQQARGAMAVQAVRALALNGSPNALLIVDQISRKFKFRQVKEAAGEALTYAAEQLGISRAELEDRIVPNLGFDSEMKRTFDYGERSFDVYLNQTLELEVFDGNGKKVKTLPAPGKKDDEEKANAAYAEFKALKKQLKTVAANQKIRLEEALSAERTWTADKWRELFVGNPVMHRFATGLIWGLYGEDGALKETFRYMEDGSFNTVDEDEYELPDAGRIGLVHPLELDEENLQAWKKQLSDYEITQPLLQLDRPVYRMTEEEKGQEELTRFGGMVLNGLSLSGKLQGQGWYRGSVQDAGGYYTFYREDGAIGVELEFSGAFIGDENEDVTVYGAAFYKAGTVKRGSYVYDEIKKENLYTLGQVSPRYFSEIVLQLAKATASSTERLAYPQCREN